MTQADLIKMIQDSSLEPTTKQHLVSNLEKNGLTEETADQIRGVFQKEIDAQFAKMGVEQDEKSAEYKKQQKKMLEEIADATKGYDKTMAGLNQQAAKLQADTAKELDKAQATAIKSAM